MGFLVLRFLGGSTCEVVSFIDANGEDVIARSIFEGYKAEHPDWKLWLVSFRMLERQCFPECEEAQIA